MDNKPENTQTSKLTGLPIPSFMLAKGYLKAKERKDRKTNLAILTIKKKNDMKQQDKLNDNTKSNTIKEIVKSQIKQDFMNKQDTLDKPLLNTKNFVKCTTQYEHDLSEYNEKIDRKLNRNIIININWPEEHFMQSLWL
jgi:hypothetical protein